MPMQNTLLEGNLRPDQEKTYVHLPFDMPVNATRLTVEYAYSDKIGSDPTLTGGNTIDLGVFDSRGIDFLNAGFRGWSGSERPSFFITKTEATPGYLAGELVPGHWHVLLGLYKIAVTGCAYRVTISILTEERPLSNPERSEGESKDVVGGRTYDNLPSSAPRAPFAPWLRGELHCHSWHSDGDRSATDVVKLARERGLDFLAISDHNTIASQRELANLNDPGLVLIRGVEATTFKGHFNIWGISDWVDFRVQKPADMEAAIQFANDRGAVTACGHPKPWGPPWEYESVSNYHCIEVWNGPWTLLNQMALDFWVKQLDTGRRIPAIAGSDWHRQKELDDNASRAPGTPTVWVYVLENPNASAILRAIRTGHIVLSDKPDGAFIDLRAGDAMGGEVIARPPNDQLELQAHCRGGAGYRLRLLDQKGVSFEQILSQNGETLTTRLAVTGSHYIRAELRTLGDELKAMTNPIYIGKTD